ncbi:MAG TPA: esterase-like activity of phytase family protein [Leadbetterella sp.]|nr:esterase-like activity of phytase family protein [Leadbetterella sp.]
MTRILKKARIFTDFKGISERIYDKSTCIFYVLFLNSKTNFICKTLILWLFTALATFAQTPKTFELIKVDSSFTLSSEVVSTLPAEVKFGGISGIEFYNNSLFGVSDRAFNSKTNQNSYIFEIDSLSQVSSSFRFFGVDNAESIRFDISTKKMFYAFEREDSTGVGFINEQIVPTNLVAFSMTNDSLTSENRGIESLCFDEKHNLWFAFESSSSGTISFFQSSFDSIKNSYDLSKRKVFHYPFESKSCLKVDQIINGSLGNGITEILPYAADKLLVMERCFDGSFVTMKLFLASIPIEGNLLSKEQVFDFSTKNEFLGQNHALKPDNMEGMCWGKDEDGHRILYVISDDNFSPKRQRTLLLKLREISHK